MHNDLITSYKQNQDDTQKKLDRNYTESEQEKFKRLEKEYDLTKDSEHAEWYLQNILINDDEKTPRHKVDNPEKWFNYA